MTRWLPLLLLILMGATCQRPVIDHAAWPEWRAAECQRPRRATIRHAAQITEHRERWRGTADLSASFLLVAEGSRVTLLGEITDDRPLQQSRVERVQPAWWLMRVGADAVGLRLIPLGGGEAVEVIAALGSAGVSPQILGARGGDVIAVEPTLTGARLRLTLDLAARGFASLEGVETVVTVHDIDGPLDWSVHRERLR